MEEKVSKNIQEDIDKINPSIEASWKEVLAPEFESNYFKLLKKFLIEERKKFKISPSFLGKTMSG